MEKIIWLILGISCETLYLFNKNTTIPRYSITRLEVLYPDLESALHGTESGEALRVAVKKHS